MENTFNKTVPSRTSTPGMERFTTLAEVITLLQEITDDDKLIIATLDDMIRRKVLGSPVKQAPARRLH